MRATRLHVDRKPLYDMSLDEARRADLEEIQANAGAGEPVARSVDRTLPGPASALPARVYWPSEPPPLPLLVYFFGGGWTLGTVDTSDAICRSLTNGAGCVTLAVGYRLAPEHKFPAAVEDCYSGLAWAAANAAELGAEPGRIAVGGDSAGGNLAAAVTLLARDRAGPRISAQLLVYPNTDFSSETPSMLENEDPVFFNRRSVAWYWEHYLEKPADGLNPLASPLRAPSLKDLPPALVVTAEYDPLRDEGEQYAERLRDSGVSVELSRYPGMIHGFFGMAGSLDAGGRAVAEAADFLRRRLARAG